MKNLIGNTFIVFLTLKLVGVITWSWFLVTCPLWSLFLLALFCKVHMEYYPASALAKDFKEHQAKAKL